VAATFSKGSTMTEEPIPLLDLTGQYRALAGLLQPQVEALLASGQYIGGAAVQRFEEQFAQFLGGGPLEAVGCNSGTDALVLALQALGIQAGDEVLTSAFSFFASAAAISRVGARPVFVDVDPCTFNLDPQLLERSISPRTKAVVVVHLFGQAANMTQILAIARRHGLAVVEDCAQAVGACWGGRPVGTWGEVGCFSFFPSKNLGAAGDGGAVVTRDPQLARRVRALQGAWADPSVPPRASGSQQPFGCAAGGDSLGEVALSAGVELAAAGDCGVLPPLAARDPGLDVAPGGGGGELGVAPVHGAGGGF
jgi:dTDP-4-amino-4,6-dideoxygalactose transaminase